MSLTLYNWHKTTFNRSNHAKYRKYFDEWFIGYTKEEMIEFKKHWSKDFINYNK